jgi:plasmid stabilization system protein ParE
MNLSSGMRRKVRIVAEAEQQIEAVYSYISQDSPEHALQWARAIRRAIERLADFPTSNPVAFDADASGKDVRRAVYGVYSIFYTTEGDDILVLAVRHVARRPIEPRSL